jgi:SAM-dependent methyltransferase
MGEYDPTEYGTHIAADYDEIYGAAFDTVGAVSRLADLAGNGPILELGVGTGRLALPLAERGLAVHGVDSSAEMLELLRAKPGGEAVATTLGDFSDVVVGRPAEFSLVVLAVNTIYALASQDEQIRCFETAARHLAPGGCFVVEAWVPEMIPAGLSLQPRLLSPGYVGLVIAEHDPARQILSTQQVVFGGAPVRVAIRARRHGALARTSPRESLAGLVSYAVRTTVAKPHFGLSLRVVESDRSNGRRQ